MAAGGWEWGCVRIEFSGKVTVITGATPHGQGQETSFAQIVGRSPGRADGGRRRPARRHERRALRPRHLRQPRDGLGGTAIVMCIDKIIAKATTLAAHLLEATPKKVVVRGRAFFCRRQVRRLGRPGAAGLRRARTSRRISSRASKRRRFFEPENFTFPFGTHIVAVEIDRETGEVKIVKYVAVDDCGPQINPLLVEGQVQGGIAHSIGQVLFEQTVYDEQGQLLTGEFMDYPMPRAEDIPEYMLGSTVTPSPSNPLGIKGVGEAGTIGATPAIANAVMDALYPLGVRHLDLPLTPEKIWRAIHAAHNRRACRLPRSRSLDAPRYTSDDVGEGALEVGNV